MSARYFLKRIMLLSSLVFLGSCKKLISIDAPKTQLVSEKVFQSDESAVAAISNIYAQFNNGVAINGNLTPYISLYSDELTGNALSGAALEFFSASVSTTNVTNLNIWKGFYSVIYQANALIEGLGQSNAVSSWTKSQLLGEAKFLRAFSYFYLVNLYGDVPLLLSTDVYKNASAARTTVGEIYQQIIADLSEAKTQLQQNYPSSQRARVNYWSAVALLSRVYLYKSKWVEAEKESSELISSAQFPLETLSNVFSKTSKETIFQAWTPNGYTGQGAVLNPAAGTPNYYLRPEFIASFDSVDERQASWTRTVQVGSGTYTVSSKYKKTMTTTGSDAEYLILLRSTEQYLIRAEARAEQNNIDGAVSDLNLIRNRCGLPDISANISKDSCLILIQEQRAKEFFTEWGQRFFDLKRYGKLNEIMSAIKPAWSSKNSVLPIPQNEINKNSSLVQNSGY